MDPINNQLSLPEATQVSVSGKEQSASSLEMMDFPMDDSAPLQITPQNRCGTNEHDSASDGLFFADATLDLDEAHDIAETPEPQKLIMKTSGAGPAVPAVNIPSLKGVSTEAEVPIQQETLMAKLGPNIGNSMNRIDGGVRVTSASSKQPTQPPRPPRRPRDIPWLVGFSIFVPLSLLISSSLSTNLEEASLVASSKASRRASLYGICLAYGASLVFARLMYRTTGGGEGEDARHVASQVIMTFAPISLGVYSLIILFIYLKTPTALSWCIVPLWFLARDLFAMRQWRTTASTAGGRQAFFQALCNMALDILSRSLRRSSFFRAVLALLSMQLIMVWWWRSAMLGALRNGSTFWLVVGFMGGKWATSAIARLLGYVSSGGVTNWFAQQTLMIDEIERHKVVERSTDRNGQANASDTPVSEEYRATDASVYQRVDLDEGIDDDYEEEDHEVNNGMTGIWSESSNSTVMSLMRTALFISFGSIVQCGLLGGLAQFLWSVVRNVDAMTNVLSSRFPTSRLGGFRGMPIGQESMEQSIGIAFKVFGRVNSWARSFVRSHTDLAMCQVPLYYKSYQRAALDVSILVDDSGMEPIFHDDITTHMCACVCGSISGGIVLFMGLVLDSHRHYDKLTDSTIVQSMVITFVLCYTLLFTVMEPLRASIKAIYVCFAQHPQSLSHSYPLIFHRLSRISEANLV